MEVDSVYEGTNDRSYVRTHSYFVAMKHGPVAVGVASDF